MASLTINSCKFFTDFFSDGIIEEKSDGNKLVAINSLKLSTANKTIKVGELFYISYIVSPSSATITPEWDYDKEKLSVQKTDSGLIVTGIAEGVSSLTCRYNGKSSTCIMTVSGYTDNYESVIDPYIYSSTNILQMTPNQSQKVSVSLFNGTAADIGDYTWTIDNPSTAAVQPTGQYAQIKALNEGYARIKITHPKAAYPYYMGIYVFNDLTTSTYITTNTNILSMNKSEGDKTINVSLVNPTSENPKATYVWNVIEGNDCINITGNGETCLVSPIKAGTATIRVTNIAAGAIYPLDIVVKVVEIVNNVYITPSTSLLTISGTSQGTVSAKLEGLNNFDYYSVDDFEWEIENNEVATFYSYGDTCVISGVSNGSTILKVKHPMAEKARQVLVIVEGQITDAVDSSCYITTTQNFVKTKVGAEEIKINVMLKGGDQTDSSKYTWTVVNSADDGSNDPVISITTPHGIVNTNARAAIQSVNEAYCLITPLKAGTATITVQNPKCYYPTEILVKVLDKNALMETPYYFTGDSIVTFLNSESYTYTVNLVGGTASDLSAIDFSTDTSGLKIVSNDNKVILSSLKSGENIYRLKASHPKAQYDKDILVVTADTEEELLTLKTFYSDKSHYAVNVNSEVTIAAKDYGFDSYTKVTDEDGNEELVQNYFDWEEVKDKVNWKSANPTIATVEKTDISPLIATVTGIKAGSTKIVCTYENVSTSFDITVYPEDVEIGKIEKSVYLTTANNVINLKKANDESVVKVSSVGLETSDAYNIIWNVEDESIISVIPNGEYATITAIAEGETKIKITHPKAENELVMYARVGSEYVEVTNPVKYISSSTDIITLKKDSQVYGITSYLVNGENNEGMKDWTYTIDDSSIAKIQTQFINGQCYIKAINAGQTELTVSHPAAEFEKKILVVVGNTDEELAAFKYLSTSTNVVTIAEGNSKKISCNIENSTEVILDGYVWTSSDPAIAAVKSYSGNTAIIQGNGIGTTKISVSNSKCTYPLEYIIQVVDSNSATAFPYIQTSSSILTLNTASSWSTVTAELVGGTESDNNLFVWTPMDHTIIDAYGQNEIGKVKAKTEGITYLTISHPKAQYSQQILCICEDTVNTECSISVSSGNILSLKPTDGDKTITANLVGGVSSDKYNFVWQLDVYDVVDLIYSANSAIITPLKEGTCTLTVTHPKSAYSQSVVIKVQQYDKFSFASISKTITQGKSTFISMQVPSSNVATHVEYTTDNDSVCQISGTSSVCQLTGIKSGTTTVHAKLVATASNSVQAESDLLVYVEETATTTNYISGNNSIYTMEVGTNKIFTANLYGADIKATDMYNMKWKSSNEDILRLSGTSTTGYATGNQVYGEALSSGECTLTVSHEKCNSDLVYYIIVPSSTDSDITLNKSFISIDEGKSTTLKATLHGANTSTSDYKNIVWTADKVNGNEIVTVNGSGQEVTIFGVKGGKTNVYANYTTTGGDVVVAQCQVEVIANKVFEWQGSSIRVNPGKTLYREYLYKPLDASIMKWLTESPDGTEYFSFEDLGDEDNDGYGTVAITGITAPNTGTTTSTLTGVTSYAAKGTLQVVASWDYSFKSTDFAGTHRIYPGNTYEYHFTVNPVDVSINLVADEERFYDYTISSVDENGNFTLTVNCTAEGKADSIVLNAVNNINGYQFGSLSAKFVSEYADNDIKFVLSKYKSESISDGNQAYYSDVINNVITIGDGEKLSCNVNATAAGTALDISEWSLSAKSGNTKYVEAATFDGNRRLVLKGCEDHTKKVWLVKSGYNANYYYNHKYSGGSSVGVANGHYMPSQTYSTASVSYTDFAWKSVTAGNLTYYALMSNTYSSVSKLQHYKSGATGKRLDEQKCFQYETGFLGAGATVIGYLDNTFTINDYGGVYAVQWYDSESGAGTCYKDTQWDPQWSSWDRGSLAVSNKEYDEDNFKQIGLWWCPGGALGVSGHVVSEFCDAVKQPTKSTALVKTDAEKDKGIGAFEASDNFVLTIQYERPFYSVNGSSKAGKKEIQCVFENRNCLCTNKPN